MKKAIIITLAVLVLWFVGYKVFAKSEPKQEHKTLKQEYIELKAQHAWYEYELLETKQKERFLEAKEQQAREKAKSFVEVMNWTGDSWKLSK